MESKYKPLPPMTLLERKAVQAARKGQSTCSDHLADLGIIPPSDTHRIHSALMRVAKRAGIYERNKWIGPLGLMIFGKDL